MNGDIIILVSVSIGTCIGALTGFCLPQTTFGEVAIGSVAGSTLGLVVGNLVWIVIADQRKHSSTPTRVTHRSGRLSRARIRRPKRIVSSRFKNGNSKATTPTPFRTRLAEFTKQEEADVMQENERYVSQMPFWSVTNLLSSVRPKSARLIRRYLLAIRRAVRNS